MKKLIVGISGATGVIYGIRLLEVMRTIDDLVNHSIGRVLDLFDLDAGILKRWEGPPERIKRTPKENHRKPNTQPAGSLRAK